MGNVLSKIVYDFCVSHSDLLCCMTFSGFQVIKTDLRSMAKSSNGVK